MAVSRRVIVVGGGVTGLTTAHALKKRGFSPIVIDAPNPGGLVRSRSIDGFSLELGANTLVMTPFMEELLADIDLTEAVRFPAIERYRQYVGYRGRIVEVPKSPPAFLRSPIFTAAEKFAILRGLSKKLAPHEISPSDTVAELFGRILGPAPAEKVIAPVLRGIFGGDLHTLKASGVFPKLYEHLAEGGSLFAYGQRQRLLRRKIFCLAGGNEEICRRLRAGLNDSVWSAAVTDISARAGLFIVSTSTGELFEGERVVVATAGGASAPFLRTLAPDAAEAALRLRFAPIAAVHFEIPGDAQLPRDGFGVLFPQTAGSSLLGIMFNSLIFPHTAPSGRHLVTVCLGGVGNEFNANESEEAVVEAGSAALTSHLGVKPVRTLSTQVWHRGIPQYDTIHGDLTAMCRRVEEAFPGLYFNGADTGGVGVPNRIEQAFLTADRLAAESERSSKADRSINARPYASNEGS